MPDHAHAGRVVDRRTDGGATGRRVQPPPAAHAQDVATVVPPDLSPRRQSLLPMREALDDGPAVQSRLALQRAMNKRSRGAAEAETTANESTPPRKKPNATGLPDGLKAGVEQLSGFAMDDVRVHYNSPKPAAVQAHAYAQGTDIHVAPGQERHLPHEAWHVVQQKQGRVKPTLQTKGVAINDDAGLEREAGAMGVSARQGGLPSHNAGAAEATSRQPIQVIQRGKRGADTNPRKTSARPKKRPKVDASTQQGAVATPKQEDKKEHDVKEKDVKSPDPVNTPPKLNAPHAPLKLTQVLKREIAHEIGTNFVIAGDAWDYIHDLIRGGGSYQFTVKGLADKLIEEGLAQSRVQSAHHRVSTHVSNPQPKTSSVFSSDVQKALPVKKNKEHRRHVIGRHTLGRACDRSQDNANVIAKFIQGNHGNVGNNILALKSEAYRILQNHLGNLWAGDRGENTAIGFFTGDLYEWFDDVISKEEGCLMDDATKSLDKISSFGYAEEHLAGLKKIIKEILGEDSTKDPKTGKEYVKISDNLTSLITEIGKNCELDLPTNMVMGYNDRVIKLFNSFTTSTKIFGDNTADDFMKLDLHAMKDDKKMT